MNERMAFLLGVVVGVYVVPIITKYVQAWRDRSLN
jgi:hypothetical protein